MKLTAKVSMPLHAMVRLRLEAVMPNNDEPDDDNWADPDRSTGPTEDDIRAAADDAYQAGLDATADAAAEDEYFDSLSPAEQEEYCRDILDGKSDDD